MKVRFSVTNWTRTPLPVAARTNRRSSSRFPRQPVHRVHDDGVTVPDKREQRVQLRPHDVLACRLVREHSIQLYTIELAIGALIQGADPNVADSLFRHRALQPEGVRLKRETPTGRASNNSDSHPNLTRFARRSDVQLGYPRWTPPTGECG
jgi:hypothetical protein